MHGVAAGVHVRRGGGVGAGEARDLAAELADPAEPEQVHGSERALIRGARQAAGPLRDHLAQRGRVVVVRHGVGPVGAVGVGGHGGERVVPGEGAETLLRAPFVGYGDDVLPSDRGSGSS